MNHELCENFTRDLIVELVRKTQDPSIYEDTAFSRGYVGALYSVLNLVWLQAQAFQIDLNELGAEDFSPGEWFKKGIQYWKE